MGNVNSPIFAQESPAVCLRRAIYSRKKPYYPTKELYILAEEPCNPFKKPYVPTKEPFILTKETYNPLKEPYVLTKEPFILTKVPYNPLKEPYVQMKELSIPATSPIISLRRAGHCDFQQSTAYLQKSPLFSQKSSTIP